MSDAEASVARDNLHDVVVRPSSSTYLSQLWSLRQFMFELPKAELKARNLDTVLGNIWFLLDPAIQIATYYLIFGLLLNTSRGVSNFLVYLGFGVFLFRMIRQSVIGGGRSLVRSQGLIRSIRFPRAILPISAVLSELLAVWPAVLLAYIIALATGETPGWDWLLVVPIVLWMSTFSLGCALVAARATDRFRDLEQILPHLFRIVFYLSAVLYAVDKFIADPSTRQTMLNLFAINPIYSLLQLARWPVLPQDVTVNAWVWASAVGWTVFFLVFGFAYFRRAEHVYGRG